MWDSFIFFIHRGKLLFHKIVRITIFELQIVKNHFFVWFKYSNRRPGENSHNNPQKATSNYTYTEYCKSCKSIWVILFQIVIKKIDLFKIFFLSLG